MEVVDPFGWHRIPSDKLHEIRDKLGGFKAKRGDISSRDARITITSCQLLKFVLRLRPA